MDADQARAILRQAKRDETYEGPIHEDDGKAVSEANTLIEMAQTAWEQHVRGPEVENILRIAAGEYGSGNGHTGDDAPSAETEEPDASGAENDADDDVAEDTEFQAPLEEPWEGYDRDKASDIIEAINIVFDSDDDDKDDVLSDVYTYEQSNKKRKTILNHLEGLAAEPVLIEQEVEPESVADEPEQAEEPVEAEDAVEEPASVADPSDDADAEYQALIEGVKSRIERERLHTPGPLPEGDAPELPFDLTTVSDKQLQALHAAFGAYAYRVGYLMMLEESAAKGCKDAADELAHYLLTQSSRIDPQTDKPKTMTLLDAEIASDPNVRKWRKRQRKHEAFAHAYRSERDSYNKCTEILSRQETMRMSEWERSGGGRKR